MLYDLEKKNAALVYTKCAISVQSYLRIHVGASSPMVKRFSLESIRREVLG